MSAGTGVVRIGVVGAGVSGLVCARTIAEAFPAHAALTVFEWGRGPGGRTARRRVDQTTENGVQIGFEHAAPFFQCDEAAGGTAGRLLSGWEAKGWVRPWEDDFLELSLGPEGPTGSDEARQSKHNRRWVAYPASNSLCKGMAGELGDSAEMLFGVHVLDAKRDDADGKWAVGAQERGSDDRQSHEFDYLILSDKLLVQQNKYGVLPADYGGPLAAANDVTSGCVAVLMAAYPSGSIPHFGSLDIEGHPVLRQIIRDNAKPGREIDAEVLVVHSTEAYAASRLQGDWFDDQEAAQAELLQELTALLEANQLPGATSTPLPSPLYVQAHMWDCAQPVDVLGSRLETARPFLLDSSQCLGACGDFCSATGGVMGAAVSGYGLATAIIEEIAAGAGAGTDFSGWWVRDNDASEGLLAFLRAHGHSAESAAQKAARIYKQRWARSKDDPLVWTVDTEATNSQSGAVDISRTVSYGLGSWEESFGGGSSLFGDQPGTVKRNTSWQPQPGSSTSVAHVTTSETPLGHEETRRWLEGGFMVCQRTFTAAGSDASPVCGTERLARVAE